MNDAADEDLWQVAVSPGDTRTMTLEQLDAAFEEGVIHETTLIAEANTNQWQPLYVVAGLDPPSAEPVPPPPVSASPAGPGATARSATAQPNPKVPLPTPSLGTAPRPSPAQVPRPGVPRPGQPPEQPRKRSPSLLETAAAVVAEAGPVPKKSNAPPLPDNAFAHLAAQAIADANSPSVSPPVSAAAPASAAPAQGWPSSAPASNTASTAPGVTPSVLPPAAPAPNMGSMAPAHAAPPPLPSGAFDHLNAGMPAPALDVDDDSMELDSTLSYRSKPVSGKREWLILGTTAALALLVILHRNGILFSISSSIGAQSAYLSLEDAVLGEPSIDTPRGVNSFLERLSRQ